MKGIQGFELVDGEGEEDEEKEEGGEGEGEGVEGGDGGVWILIELRGMWFKEKSFGLKDGERVGERGGEEGAVLGCFRRSIGSG